MSSTAKGQPNGLATLNAGGRAPIAQVARTATATLDFASIAAGAVGVLTVAVPGAVTGDMVLVAPPGNINAGLVWCGFVSAADTVSIRLINGTASPIDPASASWKVAVIPS